MAVRARSPYAANENPGREDSHERRSGQRPHQMEACAGQAIKAKVPRIRAQRERVVVDDMERKLRVQLWDYSEEFGLAVTLAR